jgi:hypothetical protein
MSNSAISPLKLTGIVLIVLGAGLAFWGYNISDSIGANINQALTGAEPDKVMMLYIGGAISFIVGIYLAIK